MEGNIFDYLEWRGDLSFTQSTVNVVDALIFSSLTYINYPVVKETTLKEAFREWSALPENDQFRGIAMMKADCLRLAEAVTNCRRFQEVRVTCYEESFSEETEKQFSAMSFLLPNRTVFLAYRGTDNSLVGWKEDFNMAFTSGTPAQLEATGYAEKVAEQYPDCLLQLGGHSKGGNLAVWAAVHLSEETRERVQHVYNNDGPGFADALTESPEYLEMSGKILSFVPESSVIGVLMGGCDFLTIKSTGVSLLQHHPFTWKIVGRSFVYDTERSRSGKAIGGFLNSMIASMEPEEISEFVEDFYASMRSDDEKTLTDLKKHLFRHVLGSLSRLNRFRIRSAEQQKRRDALQDAIEML